MDGKGCARAMRMNKLTLKAPRQLLLPRFYTYLDDVDDTLRAELSDGRISIDVDSITQMVETLSTVRFRQSMKEFAEALVVDDPNAEFWWRYMTMVSILLSFARAQRDRLWDLHLYSFKHISSGMIMSTTPDGVLCNLYLTRSPFVSGRQLRSEKNRTTLQSGLSRPKHRMAKRYRKEK